MITTDQNTHQHKPDTPQPRRCCRCAAAMNSSGQTFSLTLSSTRVSHSRIQLPKTLKLKLELADWEVSFFRQSRFFASTYQLSTTSGAATFSHLCCIISIIDFTLALSMMALLPRKKKQR